ncbi:MAG TPA: cytochrome c oxidase accessory protein CcoG, partial [Tepidisphaeraceae bacterium]
MDLVDSNPTPMAPEDHVLSTLERDGSRRWLSPKLARGRFLARRRAVAYALIVIFTVVPYMSVRGKPAILLDVVHRRFTLLGFTFLPTDTLLLALFMVGCILSVFLATALLGRVWCGWACPQTVYMEFVFRPIERLFMGRSGVGGKGRGDVAMWRTAALYLTYLLISFYLAHTFLAYFVGVEALRHWVRGSPSDHLSAFLIVAVVTALMLFNFGFFREQMCIIACPYGRLQSVLLDRFSLIISYDQIRGEPRGAMRKTTLPVLDQRGDCVDCEMCVAVCPTGIDIRKGLQIECIACAQCIDACDSVMKKVGRKPGLIRYSSQAAMAGDKRSALRPRVIIYPAILLIILTA